MIADMRSNGELDDDSIAVKDGERRRRMKRLEVSWNKRKEGNEESLSALGSWWVRSSWKRETLREKGEG
jgi:hypothetical protein